MKNKIKQSLLQQTQFSSKKGFVVPAHAIVNSEGFEEQLNGLKKIFENKKAKNAA